MWSSQQKARVDAAVAHVFRQFGEEVRIRRPVPTDPDQTYLEDLTRSETEWRVIGVVSRQPSPRLLERYGRVEPVDLLVTFAWELLKESKIPLNGAKTVRPGDVLIVRGVRHTVVQVGPDGPKAVTVEETKAVDQAIELIELPVMANISTQENVNITTTPQVVRPVASLAHILLTMPTVMLVALSRDSVFVGAPMQRIRVTVNGAIQPQANIALSAPQLLVVTLVNPVGALSTVSFSYIPQAVRPVTNGIVDAGNGEELQEAALAVQLI